jgi:hypothetical protein
VPFEDFAHLAGDRPIAREGVGIYNPGDHVKVEFATESSTESEWMLVEVRRLDDELQIWSGKSWLSVAKRSESTNGSTATEDLATYFGQPEYRYGNLPPAKF